MDPARDYEALGRQVLRALRGRRSQVALSRRLGFRTNVVHLWEAGRRSPAATDFFRLLARTGHDVRRTSELVRLEPAVDLREREGLARFLAHARGGTRMSDVAARLGVSRYVASRWIAGKTQPRLPELLALIDVLTLRLVDFLEDYVSANEIPMLAAEAAELARRRRLAFERPWSVAAVRAIEVLQGVASADPGPALARALGIPRAEVDACVESLVRAGVVRREGRALVTTPVTVDTSAASAADRLALKLHWADVGRERLARDAPGLFSWNVFSVSRADLERLRALHVSYMTTMRQIVDASTPSEVVAVANVQLFTLEGREDAAF